MSELLKERVEDSVNEENIEFTELDVSEEAHLKLRKKLIIFFMVIMVICLLFISSIILAVINMSNVKILSNVYVGNECIENLTKEEAKAKLAGSVEKKIHKEITLKHGDYEKIITLEQILTAYDIDKAIEEAYTIGREGNIFEKNYDIFLALINRTDIDSGVQYSEEKLSEIMTEFENSMDDHIVQPQYRREGSNLIVEKGKDGYLVDRDDFKNEIEKEIRNLSSELNSIRVSVKAGKPEEIDVQKLRDTIYVEPQDAYFTKEPYEVRKHVDGVDFAVSIDEAKEILSKGDQEEYVIPLKITTPQITIRQLGNEAFPNSLAVFTTKYNAGKANRSNNITLAANAINGYVLMPGEVFSYNGVVGKRTAARGYRSAPSYVGGEVVDSIGGGICQVSSTLYNSVLLSNLEVTERYNHCYTPDYVPVCRDATVAWGGCDFKFKNNRNYPIKIIAYGSGGTCRVEILGLKTQDDYNVRIESYVTGYIAPTTVYKNEPNLPSGAQRVSSGGSRGCYAVGYKILEKDGVQISKTLISKDRYNAHNKVVLVGTAGH